MEQKFNPRPEIFDRVNEGSGILVKNKSVNPKAPDLHGIIKFADEMRFGKGDELKIKAWTRHTSTGNTLISIVIDTFKPDPNYKRPYQPKPAREVQDEDDSIPF